LGTLWVNSGRRTSVFPGRCPASHGDFERLCHAATNFQI
jgi:hypothetical protein